MTERIRFFYHEKGNHDETWHYLCIGSNGEMHVETEISQGVGGGRYETLGPYSNSVTEFLSGPGGTAQDKLRKLLEKYKADNI